MKKLLRHMPLIVAVTALPLMVSRGCPWDYYSYGKTAPVAPHQDTPSKVAPAPIVVASVR